MWKRREGHSRVFSVTVKSLNHLKLYPAARRPGRGPAAWPRPSAWPPGAGPGWEAAPGPLQQAAVELLSVTRSTTTTSTWHVGDNTNTGPLSSPPYLIIDTECQLSVCMCVYFLIKLWLLTDLHLDRYIITPSVVSIVNQQANVRFKSLWYFVLHLAVSWWMMDGMDGVGCG